MIEVDLNYLTYSILTLIILSFILGRISSKCEERNDDYTDAIINNLSSQLTGALRENKVLREQLNFGSIRQQQEYARQQAEYVFRQQQAYSARQQAEDFQRYYSGFNGMGGGAQQRNSRPNQEPLKNLKDIKEKYRADAKKYHPDLVRAAGGTPKEILQAEKKMQELNTQYEIDKKAFK